MSFWRQLKYLLRKNYLLRLRQKKWVVLEIVWPLFLFLILVWVRTRDFTESYGECHYLAKAMPSAGFLPFLQSYMCTFVKNTCIKSVRADSDVGLVNSEHALLSVLAKNVEILLNKESAGENLDVFLTDVADIVDFLNSLKPADQKIDGNVKLANLLSNKEAFVENAIDNGLSNATAYNWIESSMKPNFFLEILKIATKTNVPIVASGAGSDSLGSFIDFLNRVQETLYCNYTDFKETHVIYDQKLALETANELCQMEFLFFWPIVIREKFIDTEATSVALARVAQNITGYEIPKEKFLQALQLMRKLQSDLAPNTVIGQLIRSLQSENINSTNNNSTANSLQSALCGDLAEGASNIFRGKSNVERIRDRFQGADKTAGEAQILQLRQMASRNRSSSILARSGQTQARDVSETESLLRDMAFSSTKATGANSDQDGDTNSSKILCDLIPIDMTFENKCWDWLKAFNIPSAFITQIFSILRGFVLVSPDSVLIRRFTKKLSAWMDNIIFIKTILTDLDLNADAYQDALFQSHVAKAVETLNRMVETIDKQGHIFPESTLQLLATIRTFFINSTDPKAGLPNLRKQLMPFIDLAECFRTNRFIIVPSERMLETLGTCLTDSNEYFGAIVFENLSHTANQFNPLTSYKIRLANFLTDVTSRIQDRTWNPRPRDRPFIDLKYLYYGFSFMQDAIDQAIIEEMTNQSIKIGVYAQQFPNPCFVIDGFVKAIARLLPLCMTLAWVLSASLIIKNVVYEKELRLKEFMKVMGLGNLVHWVAWFIQTFSIIVVSTFMFVFIIKFGRIVEKVDFSLFFVFLVLYSIAAITQCFMVSTLFSKANLAAACGGFIYFMFFLPYPISLPFVDIFTAGQKMLLCLSAQVAFGYGCSYLSLWEEEGEGLRWSNIFTSPDIHDTYCFAYPMFMLMFDSCLYMMITWYIETVFPGAYGIPKPWYFFIQKSYWCGNKSSSSLTLEIQDGLQPERRNSTDNNIEEAQAGAKMGVQVRNLRKVYSNGKVAVDGLNLDFYENQITSFLGHNGAGKTTTMSIITGLYPPTSGQVQVDGKDVRTNIEQIRQSLGMCPQHNVLFDILTVEEQLKFYAGLKGIPEDTIQSEVDRLIKLLNLENKRSVQAQLLSGGTQRKLSIAIAFMGQSKVVVLDEPTAGVDPYARRQIWDMLVAQKQGRTIILSTHHMDEADLLGDRIAIIASGRTKCCGSSLFLKSRYGSGYYLTLALDSDHSTLPKPSNSSLASKIILPPINNSTTAGSSQSLQTASSNITVSDDSSRTPKKIHLPSGSKRKGLTPIERHSSDPEITKSVVPEIVEPQPETSTAHNDVNDPFHELKSFIEKFAPNACLANATGREIVFTVPRDSDSTKRLADLCLQLDRRFDTLEGRNLGIASYGISETTLEEIFLRVDPVEPEPDKTLDCNEWISNNWVTFRNFIRRKCRKNEPVEMMDTSSSEEEEEAQQSKPLVRSYNSPTILSSISTINRSKFWYIRRQMRGLFAKRFLNFIRNKKGAFCEIVLPVIVIACTMFGLSLQPSSTENQPALMLHPWLYGPPNYVFYSVQNATVDSNKIAKDVLNGMVEPPGLSFRCMPNSSFSDYKCLRVDDQDRFHGARTYNEVMVDEKACYCVNKTGYTCPKKAYDPDPPNVLTNTSDYLTNMTMLNITQWLMMAEKKFRKRRYGGFSLGEVNPVANQTMNWTIVDKNIESMTSSIKRFSDKVDLNWNISSQADVDLVPANESVLPPIWTMNFTTALSRLMSGLEIQNNIKVYFNNQGWAALPAYVNVLSNAILRASLPARFNRTSFGIISYNHPMNYSKVQKGQRMAFGYNIGVELTAAVMIMLAFSVIPASFVLFLIDEKTSQAKHLQFVSGVDPNIYWITNFLWDMMNFLIPVFGVLFVFFCFNEEAYIGWFRQFLASFMLLYIYGFATIPIMYCLSFLFQVPSLAFICLATGNLFFGWISTTVTATLEVLGQDDEELLRINDICMNVFLILPQYCLGRGILDLKFAYFLYIGEKFTFGDSIPPDPFRWQVLGRNFVVMTVEGVLAFICVLFIENYKRRKFFTKRAVDKTTPLIDDDDDVMNERRYVHSAESEQCAVRIVDLTKEYDVQKCFTNCRSSGAPDKTLRAVDRICVTVQKGECFGLLGLNGAGKTSTFNMLTGKTAINAGEAFFGGLNVVKDRTAVRKHIGFCPQFDALNLLLTAREQLTLYARLRGLPEEEIPDVIELLIARLNLTNYANRISLTYSGGNKRKLSTAIALIGNPSVVLFDEPTTGMDPKARRFLWNKISEIVKDGRSVILTSHSMEECEVLCGRIGIMVNGRFRCLGSVQHLKNKYGSGYTLTIKLAGTSPKTTELDKSIKNRFPNVLLKERHYNQLRFSFPPSQTKIGLSEIFEFLIQNQSAFQIADYSLSQTTLDEVFVSFAHQQKQQEQGVVENA